MRIIHSVFFIIILLNVSCGSRDSIADKGKLLGKDYRLFQNTPVWILAKAVQDEDTIQIKKIVRDEKVDIDFPESKFGQTLLMLSISNHQYNSAKTLLEMGADPNKHDTYNGTSAIMLAAGISERGADNTKFLKLLLSRGGNPNDVEVGKRSSGNSTRNTPLMIAIGAGDQFASALPSIKLLVESGANVNYKDEFNRTPLNQAMLTDNYEAAFYLLQMGADYTQPMTIWQGDSTYIIDLLRVKLFPLGSKDYYQKMQIVTFLKQKGIDYRATPIPEHIIKEAKETYPGSWEDYLKKY